jgi:hypothetical protein
MITVGGMVSTEAEARTLAALSGVESDYLRRNDTEQQYLIQVPRLTRKEKLHLDSYMPCEQGWCPAEFEMSVDQVDQYKKIYRFYPTYVEMLL